MAADLVKVGVRVTEGPAAGLHQLYDSCAKTIGIPDILESDLRLGQLEVGRSRTNMSWPRICR